MVGHLNMNDINIDNSKFIIDPQKYRKSKSLISFLIIFKVECYHGINKAYIRQIFIYHLVNRNVVEKTYKLYFSVN